MDFLLAIQEVLWSILLTLVDASFYLLIGFICAGLVKAFVPSNAIVRHIGRPDAFSVVKASFIGAPMPLCSCSVIPMAVSLRNSGASRGATVSFLVSAPETGVDSIAISYAMLDPLMTVFRPAAAFISAFVSGIMENIISTKNSIPVTQATQIDDNCADDQCHCHEQATASDHRNLWSKIWNGVRYAFTELLGDIAYYLLIGLVISGIISAMLPDDFFSTYLSNDLMSMMVMLVIGLPMYVCASASTPIAATLILKGISPGAALVFLLAGPATNLSTMGTVKKMLGGKSFLSYILSVSLTAMLLGILLNSIYAYFNISMQVSLGTSSETVPGWIKFCSAVVLLPLLFRGLYKEIKHRLSQK